MCQEKIDMWKTSKFVSEFLGLKDQFERASELDSNASRESHYFVRLQGQKNLEEKKIYFFFKNTGEYNVWL